VSFNKPFNIAIQNYWRYASPFKGDYKLVNKKIMWKPSIEPTISYFFNKTKKKTKHIPQNKVVVKEQFFNIKYGYGSKSGQQNNLIKENQDSMTIYISNDINFFAIADGHGLFGSKVSHTIANSLKCKT